MARIRNNFPSLPTTFSRFFDDVFTRDVFDWGNNNFSQTNTTLPAVNIVENKDEFLVEMAAPGMDKKDFRIELENDMLKISSEKEMKNEVQKEDERYTRREFSYQSFTRTFHLPKTVVDESKINAKYEDGVLRIMIPKREEAKTLPPRQIEVK
jgi:HSP20 family protein